ncbi:MAG TPA: OmpA family protein [Candidatus Polarisedimenticolia bacterium]|jgi:outer membrane protein OmpA-like peptidoglycan-associated protein|nr:OmpA family protein [Candidatus Polarisedimenticolia bacterium]
MIRKALFWAAVPCLLLALAPELHAQARDNSWEIGYFAGVNFYANELKIENGFTYGVRVGWNFRPALEFEATFATSEESNLQQPTSTLLPQHPPGSFVFDPDLSAKVNSYNVRVVGNVVTDWRHWKPLAFVQVGHHDLNLTESWVPKGNQSATTLGFGGGARYYFTDNLAARMEASIEYAIADIYWNKVVTVGMVGLFGGAAPSDRDGDGISDVHDRCADTPKGAIVDRRGCPHDQDKDGVFDGLDQCADTPEKWPVDEKGCPTDIDGDGVPDGKDKCADTPKGAKVDGEGCPLDTDGDGVFDGLDQCDGTPFGAKVDAKGCPIDSDKDTVPDGLDQCDKTPAGAVVDSKGCPSDSDGDGLYDGLDECPDTPRWWTLDNKGCPTPRLDRLSLVILEKVNFKSGSAILEPDAIRTLDEAAQALIYWSDVRVEIGGYTDNRGTAAQNKALSLDRAKAVKTYFASKGVDPARLETRGYGSENPVADNNTPEGQAQNRRVEVKKIGGDESIHPPLSSYTPPPGAVTQPPEAPSQAPPEQPKDQSPPKEDAPEPSETPPQDAPPPPAYR